MRAFVATILSELRDWPASDLPKIDTSDRPFGLPPVRGPSFEVTPEVWRRINRDLIDRGLLPPDCEPNER